jgi:hypothetical protein
MKEHYIPEDAFKESGDEDPDRHAKLEPIPLDRLPHGTRSLMEKGEQFSNKTVRGIPSTERLSDLAREKEQIENEILSQVERDASGPDADEEFETEEEDREEAELFGATMSEPGSDEVLVPSGGSARMHGKNYSYPVVAGNESSTGKKGGTRAQDEPDDATLIPGAEAFEDAPSRESIRAPHLDMSSEGERRGRKIKSLVKNSIRPATPSRPASRHLSPAAFAKVKRARQRKQGKHTK